MSPHNQLQAEIKLRGPEMDQLDTIVHEVRYIRGRLDKLTDDNAAEHASLRADVAHNSVVTSLDNKSKGFVAGFSGFISAIVAGLAMYFGGGGQ